MLGISPILEYRIPARRGAGVVEALAISWMMLNPIPLFSLGRESAIIAWRAGWYIPVSPTRIAPTRIHSQLGAAA